MKKKYEAPKAVDFSSELDVAMMQSSCTAGSRPQNAQCRSGGSAVRQCQSGSTAGAKCQSGSTAGGRCRQGGNR